MFRPKHAVLLASAATALAVGGTGVAIAASGGGSSNPVTFAATGNCTSGGANGSTITITGAGSCTATVSQAGDANYNPAPDVSQSF